MLSKISLFITIFILWGCSPKYKIVYDFTPPNDLSSKECIKKCYLDQNKCFSKCDTQKISCYNRATIEAKREYQEELKIYNQKYHTYKLKLKEYISKKKRKDELEERVSYYSDICEIKKDRYACQKKYKYKYKLKKLKYIYKPVEPQKPDLNQMISDKKSTMCIQICGCDEVFRSCYVSCGGVVTPRKICIANCPND